MKKPIATVDTLRGIDVEFVQDNHSLSKDAGTLRGLPSNTTSCSSQASKMLSWSYFDVAVDIRRGSPTFGHGWDMNSQLERPGTFR